MHKIQHNMYLYTTLTQAIAYNVVKEYDKSYRTIGSADGGCLCLMGNEDILISENDVLETFELEDIVYIKFDVKKFFKDNSERHDYQNLDWMPKAVWVATETKSSNAAFEIGDKVKRSEPADEEDGEMVGKVIEIDSDRSGNTIILVEWNPDLVEGYDPGELTKV